MADAFKNSHFIHLSLKFNGGELDDVMEAVLSDIRKVIPGGKRLSDKTRRAIRQIVLNVARYPRFEYFSCSLSKKDYVGVQRTIHERYNPELIMSESLSLALAYLNNAGFITLQKGEEKKLRTRFSPTLKLKDCIIEARIDSRRIESFVETLLLRKDDKSKRNILYPETPLSLNLRTTLKAINDHNANFEVLLDGEIINTKLIRIFQASFDEDGAGGRFYPSFAKDTRHFQSLKKLERSGLTIDGESTVEADFSGFLTSMIYSKVSDILPSDPYQIEVDGEVVDRELVKAALNRMLNVESREKAAESIERELAKTNFEFSGEVEELISAIEERHAAIDYYFYRSNWRSGQRTESQIASLILEAGIRDDVPVLCMHDAFIVPASRSDWIEDKMKWASKQILGVSLKIKFKEAHELKNAA